MKALLLPIIAFTPAIAVALDFEGTTSSPIEISCEQSTGLSSVYVLDGTTGIRISSPDANARWSRFSKLGAAFAEPIAPQVSNGVSWIVPTNEDMGYILESNGQSNYFWVINYHNHEFKDGTITIASEQDCDRLHLDFTGNAPEIDYYTINGRKVALSRDIKVSYSTLVFDENSSGYVQTNTIENLVSLGSSFTINQPLCNTTVNISGDRFLSAWGREIEIESPQIEATAVSATVFATQEQREIDNEQKDNTDGLGGSAPCNIKFEAYVTDAAIYSEWQFSRSPEFDNIELSFSDLVVEHTFREQGTTYVRFVANNATGTCEYVSDTFEIFIGESKLDIPNAFSPESSPGINDEWRVSYKSLISYECHVFNKWGKCLFSSTDPAQGWDGKSGGKYVGAGTYYYVIVAEGADGVKYKKSGDINIINFKEGSGSSEQETE